MFKFCLENSFYILINIVNYVMKCIICILCNTRYPGPEKLDSFQLYYVFFAWSIC